MCGGMTPVPPPSMPRRRRGGRPGGQAATARLAARRHLPGRPGRRHRAGRAGRRRPRDGRDTRLRGQAALLFGTSALYHRGAGRRGPRSAQAAGPLQHLPHHRRHLHAVRGDPAARRTAARTLLWIVWSAALGGIAFRVFGSAPRAGSTRRSTSPSAGSPCSTSRDLPDRRSCGRHAARHRRRPLQRRRGRLRPQAAQPVTALVRLPRGVPRPHPRRRRACTTSRSRW